MALKLLTFNVNDFWHPNSRASFESAAKRWGCDIVEIKDYLGCGNPFAAKFRIDQFCGPGDRCLYLDADMLIRSDCPSPFDLVPLNKMGAVLNFQGDTHRGVPEMYQRPSWEAACAMLDIQRPYSDAEYINGGVILFSDNPQHLSLIGDLGVRITDTKGVNEQAAWSVAMSYTGYAHYLPRTFNRVGPAVWERGDVMADFVWHFAGYMEHRDKRRIADIHWRV